MTWTELINMPIEGKSVFIVGSPAGGKSLMRKEMGLLNPGHKQIETDDFMYYGFERSMYAALEEYGLYTSVGVNCIVSGVQCFRMIRKLHELGTDMPQVVINLQITHERLTNTYLSERDVTKLRGAAALWRTSLDLHYQLSEILTPDVTTLITYQNNY